MQLNIIYVIKTQNGVATVEFGQNIEYISRHTESSLNVLTNIPNIQCFPPPHVLLNLIQL